MWVDILTLLLCIVAYWVLLYTRGVVGEELDRRLA